MILTVTVPSAEIFNAYNYGYGEVVHTEDITLANGQVWIRYTVSFESRFHAEYQMNRFQSGMYGASLLDYAGNDWN